MEDYRKFGKTLKRRRDILTLAGSGIFLTILVSFIALFLASCEKISDNVRLPEFNEKLVVECFLNPDDTITYIKVATNKNIFGKLKDYQPAGTLSGTISNGEVEAPLSVWSNGLYFHHADMPVEQGKSYTLRVASSKGYSTSATCTVPTRGSYILEADTINYREVYDYYYEWNGQTDRYYYEENYARINLFITDNSDVSNYYTVNTKRVTYDTLYYGKEPYVSLSRSRDKYYSGKTLGTKRLIFSEDIYINLTPTLDSLLVTYYLLAIDDEYRIYENSFDNYTEGEVFTEVSPLYSNIEGGLGIFASYLVADSIRLKIK